VRDGETVGQGVEGEQAGEGGGRGEDGGRGGGGWAGADLLLGMHVRAGSGQFLFDHRYFCPIFFYFLKKHVDIYRPRAPRF
jgi:hypothetical protein